MPTDIAVRDDPSFKVYAQKFADDKDAFFESFGRNYGKLMALGCPSVCQVTEDADPPPPKSFPTSTEGEKKSAEFRERAMHGSLEFVQKLAEDPLTDIHEVEKSSGRSALHKAGFWGHDGTVQFLLTKGLNANLQDLDGDTALHDACRFGHLNCVQLLLKESDKELKNKEGMTPRDVAVEYGKTEIVKLF